MENIIFDLGGVVFARDPRKCPVELVDFFSFVRFSTMPVFWEEYDRGVLSVEEVTRILGQLKGREEPEVKKLIDESIIRQEEIPSTRDLIRALKDHGYRLYVLSNMSKEYIAFLRKKPVCRLFDGEIVSCEHGTVKPEPEIYRILLDRYRLNPARSLFIDDRPANLETARTFGIQTFLFDHRDPVHSCEQLRKMLL